MNKKNVPKEFICMKFRELYLKKWKGKGKTAVDFTDAINEIMPDSRCDYKYVSKWQYGQLTPVKYLPAICQVLEVDISEFTPKTHDERYRYSQEFADGLDESLRKLAEDNFGISLAFLQGLREIIPEFDKKFPKYTPLHYYGEFDAKHKAYERSISAPTSATSRESVIQIERNGEKLFLTKYDLKTLKNLQNGVRNVLLKAFDTIRTQLAEAEAKANQRHAEMILEENPNLPEDNTIWVSCQLSDEELQQIDSWGIYTVEEEKKYHLPRHGTPLYTEPDTDERGK